MHGNPEQIHKKTKVSRAWALNDQCSSTGY